MKFKIIYISLLLLYSIKVDAQTVNLSLDKCRNMAIETSYKLKSSRERLLYSKDIESAYRANYFPNISLKGTYLYSTISYNIPLAGGNLPIVTNGVPVANSFAYMPNQNYEFSVNSVFNGSAQLTQPIYMGGKIKGAHNLTKLGVEVSKIDEKREKAEILEAVDNAYYQVIELEELLLSGKKYQSVVEEFLRQVENAFTQGMKRKNDVMKIGVRLNEAKLINQQASNGLRLAKMNLCYLVGLPLTTTDLALEEPVIELEPISNNSLDITARPEYEMLEKQVKAKLIEVEISKGDLRPSVVAMASYGYTNGFKLNNSTVMNNGEFMGGVTVEIPVFHWGEGRKKLSAKRREMKIAENTLKDLTMQMQLEKMQAINEVNEAIMRVGLTKELVIQAEENMRLSKNQYDVGMETIADYLEAQSLWQKGMSDNSSAKKMLKIAYTKYLKTIGELK